MKTIRPSSRLSPLLLPAVAAGALVYAGSRRYVRHLREARGEIRSFPRDPWPDASAALFIEGYEFLPRRFAALGADIFETRLMLQKAICMRGEAAAKLFYDDRHFQRHAASPRRLRNTLFGKNGVQGLDGEAHRHRKEMFMSMMTPEKLADLAEIAAGEWGKALARWTTLDEVILFDEAREVLCRAVCAWTGVPLTDAEARMRADDFEAMIDSPGRLGPRHIEGRFARRREEQWIMEVIGKVRAGQLDVPAGRGLHTVAFHRDLDGEPLDLRIAAVELINVLRPVIAISRYVVFLALALHEHPEWHARLRSAAGDEAEIFVQEVRRLSPFFPFVAARVREGFVWQGYYFPRWTRVILDLYGTNRHPDLWDEPEAFRPERFRSWNGSAFNFIPQGGGDHYTGHRCAGEWVTIELMKGALEFLTNAMRYEVPKQDLTVPLSRMPALPNSRFVIGNVRPA